MLQLSEKKTRIEVCLTKQRKIAMGKHNETIKQENYVFFNNYPTVYFLGSQRLALRNQNLSSVNLPLKRNIYIQIWNILGHYEINIEPTWNLYICERLVSILKTIKPKQRRQVSDHNLKYGVILSVPQELTPNIEKLVKEKKSEYRY